MQSWVIFVFLYIFLHTVFTLLYRQISKEYPGHYKLIIAVIYIFLYLSGLIYALYRGNLDFSTTLSLLPFLIVGGLIFAFAFSYGTLAITKIDAVQHTILSKVRVIVTVLASTLLLSESLTERQIIGGILILVGTTIASLEFRKKKLTISKYSLIALASGVLLGLAITNEKYILDHMNFETYLIIGWGFQSLPLVVMARKQLKKAFVEIPKNILKKLVVTGIIRGLSGMAFVLALITSDNSSVVSVSSAFLVVAVLLSGAIFLKERDHLYQKTISSLLALVGLLIVIS